MIVLLFFFNDTATTEIYTLSLHDALPICGGPWPGRRGRARGTRTAGPAGCRACNRARRSRRPRRARGGSPFPRRRSRSGEHTSELQSRPYLVCRLLLVKKKKTRIQPLHIK